MTFGLSRHRSQTCVSRALMYFQCHPITAARHVNKYIYISPACVIFLCLRSQTTLICTIMPVRTFYVAPLAGGRAGVKTTWHRRKFAVPIPLSLEGVLLLTRNHDDLKLPLHCPCCQYILGVFISPIASRSNIEKIYLFSPRTCRMRVNNTSRVRIGKGR